MDTSEDQTYSLAISIGGLVLADELAKAEYLSERREKQQRVVELKRKLILDTFPDAMADASTSSQIIERLPTNLTSEQKITLLIDLAFSNPFAPYELKFGDGDFRNALKVFAKHINIDAERVDSILKTKKAAIKSHRHVNVGKVLAYGVGGAVFIGLGGYLVAPVIATALGTAAGLYGVAATSYGMALLGGGSLAAGGAGMAGGLYLVTGTAIAIGGTAMGGASLLFELGAAGARMEIAKLQTSYREVLLYEHLSTYKANDVINALEKEHREVQEMLKKERALNEKNATRLKDIEATGEALENAIKWMKQEANNSAPT